MAYRWTFYIGPDGKLLYVDKAVSTATAGADIAKRLGELGVKKRDSATPGSAGFRRSVGFRQVDEVRQDHLT